MNPRLVALATLLLGLVLLVSPGRLAAQESWVINTFDATYTVNPDGSVDVVEDLNVDFGSEQKHGIFRDIPVEYHYDPDPKYVRVTSIDVQGVDNGQSPVKYTTSRIGAKIEIKIGDPDVLVSGKQRYVIHYSVRGALNPQPNTDEFYWNATGNSWEVSIERASARVNVPVLDGLACYQGPTGSTDPCFTTVQGNTATYQSTEPLPPGSGLTIVTGLEQGSVAVPPLNLVRVKSTSDKVKDFIGLGPVPLALAAFLAILGPLALVRYWWLSGRDLWSGDVQFLTGQTEVKARPLFAKDTIVVEYTPPELEQRGRRLRPAEIGTLMDERADTLDVTATFVDLAVRGYMRITEVPKTWLFGSVDYRLEKLKEPDAELLPYEKLLMDKVFTSPSIEMSELKDEFYEDLAKIKEALYNQVVKQDKLFPGNPEKVRTYHQIAGIVVMGLGAAAIWGLGAAFGAAIIGVPIVIAGLLILVAARFMPRRSAAGHEMYRRCRGFREYMVVAETDRQRFAEEANIFQEYLPYAIVYECVDKWAKAFEGLDKMPDTSTWYVSPSAFAPLAFSQSMQSFSSSISSAIASTPGGSGGSGFSGGSSGGGGGGGGGGSW